MELVKGHRDPVLTQKEGWEKSSVPEPLPSLHKAPRFNI